MSQANQQVGSKLSSSLMAPQPATFAHSKEDVLKALSFYFGEPISPEKLRDYNEHHAATYHFPGVLTLTSLKTLFCCTFDASIANTYFWSFVEQMRTPAATHSSVTPSTTSSSIT